MEISHADMNLTNNMYCGYDSGKWPKSVVDDKLKVYAKITEDYNKFKGYHDDMKVRYRELLVKMKTKIDAA